MKTKLISITIAAIGALSACSKDVSFDTLETARKQAKENAEFNARHMLRAVLVKQGAQVCC